ncbi:MAG: ABC transporter permease [Pirellulales bacterium]
MSWIAFKMLTGNPIKYAGIIFGVFVSALLITQQASIFIGLMSLTSSQIRDIQGANLWVMDPNVRFVDDIKPISTNDLLRVRGVSGVKWAVPLYKGLTRARLADGNFQQIILLGLDDATLVGAPQTILFGSLSDLRRPDAIIMDSAGYKQLWPGEPFVAGKTFEMNDRRAVLVGVCVASKTFATFPVVYTRYSQAIQFIPPERKVMSFILAQSDPGVDEAALCAKIQSQTGLLAMTQDDFGDKTIMYYFHNTGIPMNFGITVILGFLVGTAIAGLTFYMFTIDNLKQFGTLKAMGVTNSRIVAMVLLQSVIVAILGYGLGVGGAAGFGLLAKVTAKLAFRMTWHVLAITGGAVVLIAFLSSILSVLRALTVEPAIVFHD